MNKMVNGMAAVPIGISIKGRVNEARGPIENVVMAAIEKWIANLKDDLRLNRSSKYPVKARPKAMMPTNMYSLKKNPHAMVAAYPRPIANRTPSPPFLGVGFAWSERSLGISLM